MRISDWSSDVCSSDLDVLAELRERQLDRVRAGREDHVAALELDGAAVVLLQRHDVEGLPLAEDAVRGDLVDRKSVVEGKSVSVSVDIGGSSIIKKNKTSEVHVTELA